MTPKSIMCATIIIVFYSRVGDRAKRYSIKYKHPSSSTSSMYTWLETVIWQKINKQWTESGGLDLWARQVWPTGTTQFLLISLSKALHHNDLINTGPRPTVG